ncbi:MAG TPA: glycoside hydrolase domain-containing protein, partial [Gemmatimonadaceae bacterium]
GANVINVHHRTDINPYLNYPFLRPDAMKTYIDDAHARNMKVKIYYTVRELSDHAPELFALQSLGHEIFSSGNGGGPSWLQEHFGTDYTAGWFVPERNDATAVMNGQSRWHNYYIEGLDWLARNVGIDGIYLDDVAFDRTTMQRVRKVLDRRRPGALIDLHSANQYDPADGFASSANLYMEYFPYINRLWFGEGFDYVTTPPDYWLVEVSGIPFGLMGEMLQGGGNPWRGMVYGMTNRVYTDDSTYHGNPIALWKAWDDFGIKTSKMVGYWDPRAPVTTGRSDVLATSYVRPGRVLVAIGSWAPDTARIELNIDWKALGIDSSKAVMTEPAIAGFQRATSFDIADAIPISPAKGALVVIRER